MTKEKMRIKAGFETAKDCFDYAFRTGKTGPGTAPYVSFVEAVAWSMRNKEEISQARIGALEKLLQIEPGNKFNQGVYDFLIEKIREYKLKPMNIEELADKILTDAFERWKKMYPEQANITFEEWKRSIKNIEVIRNKRVEA